MATLNQVAKQEEKELILLHAINFRKISLQTLILILQSHVRWANRKERTIFRLHQHAPAPADFFTKRKQDLMARLLTGIYTTDRQTKTIALLQKDIFYLTAHLILQNQNTRLVCRWKISPILNGMKHSLLRLLN